MALLEVDNIGQSFGGLVALNGVTFVVNAGLIKGVIGPNGAGKTTLFNIISGVQTPREGVVRFEGQPITGSPPYRIARMGISRTFQNLSLFLNLSALENVMVGRHCRTRQGWLGGALRTPAQRREEKAIREEAMARLEAMGIADTASIAVGALPFGKRRLVELARALATEPRLLLLDEPASGLNSRETDALADRIRRIKDVGVTILLVEHDMSLVMDICDDILVLDFGKPIAEGPPAVVRGNPEVIAVYLGGEFDDVAG